MSEKNYNEEAAREVFLRIREKVKNISFLTDYNWAILEGKVEKEIEFSHKDASGQRHYKTTIEVRRISGSVDYINVVIPGYVLKKQDIENIRENEWLEILGEFRSFNRKVKDLNPRVEYFVLARAINVLRTKYGDNWYDTNMVYLNGFIRRKPNLEKTSKGGIISEFIVKTYRKYKISDYIPCIAWDENAIWAHHNLNEKDGVVIIGRVQSREYDKKVSEQRTIRITTHEVVVKKIDGKRF